MLDDYKVKEYDNFKKRLQYTIAQNLSKKNSIICNYRINVS